MKLTPGRFIAALFVVALVAAVFFTQGKIGYGQDKDVSFCKKCHEMNADIATWEVSAHNQINCVDCHQDLNYFDFWYKHWQNWFNTPIKSKTFVPNSVCLKCHSENRTFTPEGDVIIPHDLHIKKQVDCTDCHSNIAHYNIADQLKENISVSELAAFDKADAMRYKEKEKFVTMKRCFVCHNGEKATDQCSACHSTREDADVKPN